MQSRKFLSCKSSQEFLGLCFQKKKEKIGEGGNSWNMSENWLILRKLNQIQQILQGELYLENLTGKASTVRTWFSLLQEIPGRSHPLRAGGEFRNAILVL